MTDEDEDRTIMLVLPIPRDLREGGGGLILRVSLLFYPGPSADDLDYLRPEVLVETADALYVNPMRGFQEAGINAAMILETLAVPGHAEGAARAILLRFHAMPAAHREKFRVPEDDDDDDGHPNPDTIH